MKNLFRKVVNKILLPHSQLIYSQAGEDLILANLFYKRNIVRPTYLDIGANDPQYISNTFYFYMRGSSGVCIEPNPKLSKKIKRVRERDTVLNIGIGVDDRAEADFYLFPDYAHGLSTFSREDAQYWEDIGMAQIGKIKYERIIKVPLQTINNVIKAHFSSAPDFINIDVEGLDLQILRTLDFNLYSPIAICVETLYYDGQQKEHKRNEVAEFLETKGYSLYADTHINSIFHKE